MARLRKPLALDPLKRAKTFTNMPSPRKEMQSVERRVRKIESLAQLALGVALTPPGETRIEHLTQLPDATAADIGRKIVVQDPETGAVSEYTGELSPDGVPFWFQIAGTPSILAYSWVSSFAVTGPRHLCMRPQDKYVLVSRDASDRVETYRPDGSLWQSWGTTSSCSLTASGTQIESPYGIAYVGETTCFITYRDCHNVAVWDDVANTLRNVDFSLGATLGTGANFNTPRGLAFDDTTLYVADSGNNRIVKRSLTPPYDYLGQVGSVGSGNGQFSDPYAVAVDSLGNLYVADRLNHRIQKLTNSGTFVWSVGGPGSGADAGKFNSPQALAFDPLGRLHVADTSNHRVQVFDQNGVFLTTYGTLGSGASQLNGPVGIAIDATGLVYVADISNNRLTVWQEGATITSPPVPDLLNDLDDVAISGPAGGHFLRFSGGFWRNQSVGVYRRTSTINNLKPGFCGTTTANCQSGEAVVGGGVENTTSNARGPYRSRPNSGGGGWDCGYCNQDDINIDVTCHAVCLRLFE